MVITSALTHKTTVFVDAEIQKYLSFFTLNFPMCGCIISREPLTNCTLLYTSQLPPYNAECGQVALYWAVVSMNGVWMFFAGISTNNSKFGCCGKAETDVNVTAGMSRITHSRCILPAFLC